MQAESSNPNATIVADSPIPNTAAPNKKLPIKKLLLLGGLGIGLVFAGITGYNWWQFASTHQETDDAYVTASLCQSHTNKARHY